jgi:hypothetical protein
MCVVVERDSGSLAAEHTASSTTARLHEPGDD